jgi:preprotein translocase subunit SecD
MTRSWWMKFLLFAFLTGLSAVYVYPTIANLDLEKTKFPFKQKVNLGLDLQGGLYLVLGVDFNKVYRDVVERQSGSIQQRLKEKGYTTSTVKFVKDGYPAEDPRIIVTLDPAKKQEIHDLIKNEYFNLRFAGEKANEYELGLTREYRGDVRDKTISQSIEVIRNRIDEFGVAEPSIVSQGTDRVVVELPGIREVERAKALIGQTAKLEFKIVDDQTMAPAQLMTLIAEIEKTNNLTYKEGTKFSDYVRHRNLF